MRILASALLAATCVALNGVSAADRKSVLSNAKDAVKDLGADDEKYWSRLLQDSGSVTPPPTPPPATPPPTPPPTPVGECLVEVDIECVAPDGGGNVPAGTPCDEIPPIDGNCAASDEPLTKLTFSYEYCDCDASNNSQQNDGTYVCEDDEDFCVAATRVRVTCVGDGFLFEKNTIRPDRPSRFFTLEADEGDTLPDTITCTISSPNGVNVCQEVTFDTSGTVDLELRDKFGSLVLESCEDEEGNESDCFLDIKYTYAIENVGDSPMDITELIRTRDGETEDLIDLVDPSFLEPGESVFPMEPEVLDRCEEACFNTSVTVKADPPAGVPCEDTDTDGFCVELPCDVDVDMRCVIDDGSGDDCDEITPPPETCGECIERMIISWRDTTCAEEDNDQQDSECEDFPENDIPEGGLALITCVNAERVFCNCTVRIDETITIIGVEGGKLPDDLDCTIANAETGDVAQQVMFDASGEGVINLKDTFGSLQIEGCRDVDGGNNFNCLVPVTYNYVVSNNNDAAVSLTELERTCDGEVRDLLPADGLDIPPNQQVVVGEPATIDSCDPGCINKTVTVVAEAEDGSICEDEDGLDVCIPERTCDITTNLECFIDDESGDSCDEIPNPDRTCTGGECVDVLVISWIDITCDEEDNDQPDSTCADFLANSIPEGGLALVTCVNAERVFCNCTVRIDETISIRGFNGTCLPDDLECTIANAETGEIEQEITFDASGSDPNVPLDLKDTFGGLQIERCRDRAGSFDNNCLVEVDYRYQIVNGVDPVQITEFERDCDEELLNLIEGVPAGQLQLQGGQPLTVEEPAVIDACVPDCYNKVLTANGEVLSGGGGDCPSSSELNFCIGDN